MSCPDEAAATPTGSNLEHAASGDLARIQVELRECLEDLRQAAGLGSGSLLVVGASSSEVMGQRIGTATSEAVGAAIVASVFEFAEQCGCSVAVQCCEHLNRALVVERETAVRYGLEEVYAIPVPGAGGAVAAHAYFSMRQPCLVSAVRADAGIDIGDTLIGMHLKPVAVPVRGRRNTVGAAHVTMARTRPPRIGGERAVYDVAEARRRIGR
ncbi:UPF0340 protein [Alicyclobacillus contaminans]|nr:UPF0340 protein [Alicyclobacillus contaminans]